MNIKKERLWFPCKNSAPVRTRRDLSVLFLKIFLFSKTCSIMQVFAYYQSFLRYGLDKKSQIFSFDDTYSHYVHEENCFTANKH